VANYEPEFTGTKLHRLIVDLQGVVAAHAAGLTPLGLIVMRFTEDAWREWMESHAKKAKELEEKK